MNRCIFLVTFHFVLLQCYCSANPDYDQQSKPIETIYPGCFHPFKTTGIMVHKEYFNTQHGYAVTPFKTREKGRNHFNRRNVDDKIMIIVLHYTVIDFGVTVKHFTSNKSKLRVSSHYVVARPTEAVETDKQLLQVVPENSVAYHAGVSFWANHTMLNPISIGIEIVNAGLGEPFYEQQIRIVGRMVARMVGQYNVLPHFVVGHSDVAPCRKVDPGVMFPWAQLYHIYGVGAWLDDDELDESVVMARYRPSAPCHRSPNHMVFAEYLRAYGYHVAGSFHCTILAFKAHFTANQKPHMYNARLTELEMYWIWALVAKYSDRNYHL